MGEWRIVNEEWRIVNVVSWMLAPGFLGRECLLERVHKPFSGGHRRDDRDAQSAVPGRFARGRTDHGDHRPGERLKPDEIHGIEYCRRAEECRRVHLTGEQC